MKKKQIIAVVSLVWILLVAAVIVVPNIINPKNVPAANPCANNLRRLDGSKQQWSLEYRKTTNDTPTMADLLPYLGRPVTCPEGGKYILGRVGEDPKCSVGGRHTLY